MMWQDATVAVFGILLVIVIVSVLLWQIFRTAQTKISADATLQKEAVLNQAIADATAAQQVTAARLAELSEGVEELRMRMSAIEKLLKEVE